MRRAFKSTGIHYKKIKKVLLFFERSRKCGFFFGYRKFCSGKNFCNKILNQAVFYGIIGMKIISFPFWENIVNNGEQVEGDFFMKAKRISAWIIAVSLCITNSGLVYAAENTGVEESSIQEVQEEDSIKEKKDEEPAAECVSEDVQAEISNENELSGEITTETENVAENGTQEQHDWEAKLYLDGTAEITKYTGSDKDVVIPSTIEGHTVTSLEQDVFRNNTTVESIHIPATVTYMGHPGDVVTTTFNGTTSLKSITVENGNPKFYSEDGILFMYSYSEKIPMLVIYPSSKDGTSYCIPKNVGMICDYAFSESVNLQKIIVPDTINDIFTCAFSDLSDKSIIFCHVDPSQIELYTGFCRLENCRIIVKNQNMKSAVENNLGPKSTVNVLLESELSAEERNAYLTPATDLTFADGSRTKNITLEPEENCTIDYQLFPEDTTDVVTWESSDDSIAKVECVNGKVTVTGKVDGKCVITGRDQSGHSVKLNITVFTKIESVTLGNSNVLENGADTPDVDSNGYEIIKWQYADDCKRAYLSVNPSNATYKNNVKWSSSDPSVISVKGNGSKAELDIQKVGVATLKAVLTETDSGKTYVREKTFHVTKSVRWDCDISVSNIKHSGELPKVPEIPKVVVKDGDKVLKEGIDYIVAAEYQGVYEQMVEMEKKYPYDDGYFVNNALVTITGKGNYDGIGWEYYTVRANYKTEKTDQKKDNTTEKKTKKSNQKITGISSSYKKAYGSSFTLKPKAKGKITYKSNNTKVATVNSKGKVKIKGTGKVTITITAKETSAYKKQTKKVTIYAVPGKRDIKKPSSGKKKLTVQWKKDNRSDGYQVQYSTDKKFKKNVKSVVIGKKQTTKQTIKKLKTGKKYYVRIRSYKKISGKKYYGTWSSKKTVKVK